MRYFNQSLDKRSTTVPDFINTPVDVLALALFDLMAPISLKLASVDGAIDPTEREAIESYFVSEWGYSSRFVNEGMAFTESQLPDLSVKELAQALADLKKSNRIAITTKCLANLLPFCVKSLRPTAGSTLPRKLRLQRFRRFLMQPENLGSERLQRR
ncbi:MAG: hypothetical protein U5L08_07550 [Xanthomonadales bacterium]|nr:hypothetical protein [Xanthomonadales bacterium]